jgi:D-serine dehydratase
VLLELGVNGGRTGVRDDATQAEVLAAIAAWPQTLALAGVEVYEGVLKEETAIRAFLQRALSVLKELDAVSAITTPSAILTGAGSAWFDVVAEEWAGQQLSRPLDIVLRPGCYLTHDVGIYQAAASRINANNPIAHAMASSLQPALQLWAYVQSIPEAGLAIIGLGKRDAAFDAGLPVPALHYRPGASAPSVAPSSWQLSGMMDQHAYLRVPTDADIAVGDMLALDISHPCLTFDKWRQLLLVDTNYTVIDAVETFF